MSQVNNTWMRATPEQLIQIYRIPEEIAQNPRNLFWGERDTLTPPSWLDQPLPFIGYMPKENNHDQLVIFTVQGELRDYASYNPFETEVVSNYLSLNKQQLIDTISIFEEIQQQLIVDTFTSYFSVLDDHKDPRMPDFPDGYSAYYLSSYEKKVLRKSLMGALHYARDKRAAKGIFLKIGHFPFAGTIPTRGYLKEDGMRSGIFMNFSVLGVIIELLKQQLPSMI